MYIICQLKTKIPTFWYGPEPTAFQTLCGETGWMPFSFLLYLLKICLWPILLWSIWLCKTHPVTPLSLVWCNEVWLLCVWNTPPELVYLFMAPDKSVGHTWLCGTSAVPELLTLSGPCCSLVTKLHPASPTEVRINLKPPLESQMVRWLLQTFSKDPFSWNRSGKASVVDGSPLTALRCTCQV